MSPKRKRNCFSPALLHRVGDEQNHLGIGAVAVGDAEAFDAGLAELARMRSARALRLKAEGWAVIAIAGWRIGARVTLEIKPRHRHGEVWPEAQLFAGKIGEDVGAASDRFADLIEKDVGGLDDGRRNLLVAASPENFEQGGGLGFESLEFSRQFRGHGSGLVAGEDAPDRFDELRLRHGELGLGLLLQIVVAVLDRGERGAEDRDP